MPASVWIEILRPWLDEVSRMLSSVAFQPTQPLKRAAETYLFP
jgi:hypothetical protein